MIGPGWLWIVNKAVRRIRARDPWWHHMWADETALGGVLEIHHFWSAGMHIERMTAETWITFPWSHVWYLVCLHAGGKRDFPVLTKDIICTWDILWTSHLCLFTYFNWRYSYVFFILTVVMFNLWFIYRSVVILVLFIFCFGKCEVNRPSITAIQIDTWGMGPSIHSWKSHYSVHRAHAAYRAHPGSLTSHEYIHSPHRFTFLPTIRTHSVPVTKSQTARPTHHAPGLSVSVLGIPDTASLKVSCGFMIKPLPLPS